MQCLSAILSRHIVSPSMPICLLSVLSYDSPDPVQSTGLSHTYFFMIIIIKHCHFIQPIFLAINFLFAVWTIFCCTFPFFCAAPCPVHGGEIRRMLTDWDMSAPQVSFPSRPRAAMQHGNCSFFNFCIISLTLRACAVRSLYRRPMHDVKH